MKLKKVSAGHYEADGGRIRAMHGRYWKDTVWQVYVYGVPCLTFDLLQDVRAWVVELNTEGSA